MRQFKSYVESELNELESRDPDTLYICIKENIEDMGFVLTETMDEELWNEINTQLVEKSLSFEKMNR